VRVERVTPVSIGRLAPLYRMAPGVGVAVEVPAEFGSVGVALSRFSYHRRPDGPAPDFTADVRTLAWRSPALRVRRARLTAGGKLADFSMAFADSALVEGLRDERELLVAATVRAEIAVTSRLALSFDVDAGRIMFNNPVDLRTVSAGAVWFSRSPDWLRRFLQ
jgi:hypothetical protein